MSTTPSEPTGPAPDDQAEGATQAPDGAPSGSSMSSDSDAAGEDAAGEGVVRDETRPDAPTVPDAPAEATVRPPSIPVGAAAPKPRADTHPDTDEIEVVLPLSVVRVVPRPAGDPEAAARPASGARPAPGGRAAPAGTPARATRPAPTGRPRPAEDAEQSPVPVGDARDGSPDRSDEQPGTAGPTGGTSPGATPGSRLGSAFRPRFTRAQVLAAVLCAVLGFALVVQLQQNQQDEFSGLRQSDLVRILDDVSKRSDSLEREATALRETEFELRSGSDSQQAAVELAEKNAEILGILSGRLPAEGPGLELQIVQGDTPISAARLFNVLEELRNAGAEAIDVNGIRMVTSSYFEDTGTGVSIDGIVVSPPYRWTVIGDPQTLEPAMAIPGGAMASITTNGGRTTIEQKELVQIRSVRDPSEPRFATPATDG